MALLTKSNYLLGLQCSKLLWVTKNQKERIPEPDEITLATFNTGNIVGILATKVFGEGIDLSELTFKVNIDKTKESLKLRKPIFEAGFMVDNLFSRGDILLPVGKDEWDIIEVKSSTEVKDVNIHDVSFQKYVYEKAGLKIRHCILMHINNQYVKSGNIEPNEFFVQADITEQVEEFSKDIKDRIENMLKIINSKEEPKISIGLHCSKPYDCPLIDECWKDVPKGSVFEFYRMFKSKCFDLHNNGIVCLNEVPEDIKLNDKQKIQRRLAFDGGKHIDKLAIKNFLNKLEYPIYYLDFETINPAIPKFDGMKPYQKIPFQFSLHIQEKPNGKLKHISFLADGISDPRPKFLQSLKDNLGEKGSILVYNQAFEKGVLNECSISFPEFKEWYEKNILPRIKDLWDVFKDFSYYDPAQKGSTSLKYVLPVLSDLSYDEMDIKNGALASLEYERVTYKNVGEKERLKVREALEEYCEMDTMAEVEIVNGLKEVLNKLDLK
tara:strand:+ start:869 stop:2353 length:1485 start_codon:yes stop_codon:yes gene_type:complete